MNTQIVKSIHVIFKVLVIMTLLGTFSINIVNCSGGPKLIKKGKTEQTEEQSEEEEFTEADLLKVAGLISLTSDDENIRKIGSVTYEIGNSKQERVVAKAGKTEVNIYGSQYSEQPYKEDPYFVLKGKIDDWLPLPSSFICLGKEDLNKDGYIGRDELVAPGNSFECKDYNLELLCGTDWSYVLGKQITSKITNKTKGEIVRIDPFKIIQEFAVCWTPLSLYKENNQGIHEYTVEWFVEGVKLSSRTRTFFVDFGN